MDFLLISSPNIAESTPAIRKRLMAAPLMSPIDGPLGFFEFGGLFVAANGHQTNETTTLCYDGCGIGQRAAFSSGCVASLPIDTANAYLDACLDPVSENDLRGVFSLMRFNPHTKAFTVAVDPLAHYPIFICGLGDTLVVSNNCYLIEHTVNAMGLKLTRSSKLAATSSALGAGLGNRTGFLEIALLPPGQLVTGIGPNWRLVSTAKQPKLAAASYDDLLEVAARRLDDSIAAIARSGRDQNVHIDLDGGLYSRLLLAAAVHADLPNLKVSLSKHRPADSSIVRLLAAQCGADLMSTAVDDSDPATNAVQAARMMAFRAQGLAEISPLPPKPPTTSRGKNTFLIRSSRQITHAERFSSTAPKSLFWSRPIPAMQQFSSNDPVYGACLAAYWQTVTNKRQKTAAKWAYQICGQSRPLQALYHKRFLRAATNTIIEQLNASDAPTETMGPGYIAADRRRRELGLQSRQDNLLCGVFDPLLDPVITSIINQLERYKKSGVNFTVDLIDIPFAPDVLNGDAGAVLALKLKLSKKKLLQQSTDISTGSAPEFVADFGLDKNSDFQTRVETAKVILPELAALAAALPVDHECWQYFRRDRLLAALKDGAIFLNDRAGTAHLFQLLQTFIWAASVEDKTGIETLD